MPIVGGVKVKARYTALKLNELSSVDRPAQPGARMVIMKRDERGDQVAEIAKYICAEDGAHTFAEVLTENKFSEAIWPYTDALSQSIRSIVGDSSVTGADREMQITASVQQFLAAVRSISPETEKQLVELTTKRDDSMNEIETLKSEVSRLTLANAELTSKLATSEKAFTDMKEEKDKADTACADAKKALTAATDEVIKSGETEVRKSEVGEANFAMMKAMRDERDMAQFEKRADAEFGNLVGTTAEKALVLKAIDGMSDDAKKAATAMLTAAEKMTAAGFERLGSAGGHYTPTNKQATDTFTQKVAEIEKRDNISHSEAMTKARTEFPTEFAASQGN